jgi:hypothetical protein
MKHFSMSLLLVLNLFAVTAKGEDQNKPSPEIQKLSRSIGAWKAEEKNYESPVGPAGASTYKSQIRFVHNGHFIEEHGKGISMGKPVTYTTLTYWDAKAKVYRGIYYDSNGFIFPAEGTFENDTMTFHGKMEADGKTYQMKGITTFSPDYKSSKYEWNYSQDGGSTWKPMFIGTASRTGH